MRLTQEDDYGLRTVLYLCKNRGKRIEAKEIAGSEAIPERFLLKLLRKLTVAGITKSYMGSGGGYSFEKDPSQISLLDVITAVEGEIYINKCLEDPANCNAGRADYCIIHKQLDTIQSKLLANLASVSFQNLLDQQNEKKIN